MKFRIIFDEDAESDLIAIYAYVAERGAESTAFRYIGRILKKCRSLETFPLRGRSYDHIRKGLRVVGFEKQLSIAFTIVEDTVRILRVHHGGLATPPDERKPSS